MLYELRRYTVPAGRQDDLHTVITDHVRPVLQAAGVQELGYWTGHEDEEDVFVYLLGFRDDDHRAATWQRLRSTPEWASLTEGFGDAPPWGAIRSTSLTPTAYSPAG